MMRRIIAAAIALILLVSLASCAKKIVHCDNCGKEIKISAKSNMTEDWIIFCGDCEKELGLDNVVEPRE